MRPLALALAVLVVTGCAVQPDLSNHLSDSDSPTDSSEVLTFADGQSLAGSTVVGVHAELGDDWLFIDGGASLGYAKWFNEGLGCSLMLVVATPIADLPHDLPDAAGSSRLARKYGSASGEEESYRYPVVGGSLVEMASLSSTSSEGSRITLAREFSQLRSAVILDLGCSSESRITSVLTGLDVSVSVTALA